MKISRRSLFVALFCFAFFGLLLPAQGAGQQKPATGKAKGESLKKQEAEQKPVIDKVKIESHVRRLNMWPPQIKISVGDPEPSAVPGLFAVGIHADAGHGIVLDDKWYVSRDGQTLLRANLIQVKNDLFQETLDQMNTENRPAFGDPNGLVTVVVFSDFQCPFCRSEAITLRDKIPAAYPKEVRVVFADFPLEGLHPWSKPAAIIGRCLYKQDPKKFWGYHDWVFKAQGEITPENLMSKFISYADTDHINTAQVEQCARDENVAREVDQSITLGRALHIATLPTVFVNGRSLENPSWDRLTGVIDYELEYRKKLQEACNCGLPKNPEKKN